MYIYLYPVCSCKKNGSYYPGYNMLMILSIISSVLYFMETEMKYDTILTFGARWLT